MILQTASFRRSSSSVIWALQGTCPGLSNTVSTTSMGAQAPRMGSSKALSISARRLTVLISLEDQVSTRAHLLSYPLASCVSSTLEYSQESVSQDHTLAFRLRPLQPKETYYLPGAA